MGWFLISILIPVVAPVVLLSLYMLAPVQPSTQTNLITQVKDGQLSWAAFAFCASALYELAAARIPLDKSVANWSQGVMTALLLISAFFAFFSVVHPTPIPPPAGRPWYRHFGLLVGSGLVVSASAVAYTCLHFAINALNG